MIEKMKKPHVKLEKRIETDQAFIEKFEVTEELYELQPLTTEKDYRVFLCPNHVHIIDRSTPPHLVGFDDVHFTNIFKDMYENPIIDIRIYNRKIQITPLEPPEPCRINEYETALGKGKLQVDVDIVYDRSKTASTLQMSHGEYFS